MIDSSAPLNDFLPLLRDSAFVALDTEADSLHAYPEKLCLLQIGIVGSEVLVDPLAGLDLTPLFATLAGRELLLHGADYDLRLMRKHHNFLPSILFDTMPAARLLGQRQFSLSALVEHYLGIKLEKGSQKADWARRPLTPRMADYAMNDVRHLKPLVDKLREELQRKGRLEWHQEWCARLIQEAAQDPGPDPEIVWRIKGSSVLGPPALAVLRSLWKWREAEATHADRPPFFILQHEAMVALAATTANGEDCSRWIPQRFSTRRRETLRQALAAGVAVPPEAQPQVLLPTGRRPTMAQVKRIREITERRDRHAKQLELDPALIASRPVLARLGCDWAAHESELMNWQRELLK